MKTLVLAATMFVLCLANATGQGKVLTNDSLTGLPLIPATDSGRRVDGMLVGNEPTKMPDGQVCKSKMQGDFYLINKTKVDAAVAWYSSHLSGFKKVQGYESGRSQIAFYKPDGTIVVLVTGESGVAGENANAYSVAYERYQPGISEKTITGLTHGKIVCQ
jgi:hypothetical protein